MTNKQITFFNVCVLFISLTLLCSIGHFLGSPGNGSLRFSEVLPDISTAGTITICLFLTFIVLLLGWTYSEVYNLTISYFGGIVALAICLPPNVGSLSSAFLVICGIIAWLFSTSALTLVLKLKKETSRIPAPILIFNGLGSLIATTMVKLFLIS